MRVSQAVNRTTLQKVGFQALLAVLLGLIGVLIFAQFRSEGALRSARVAASGTDRAIFISGLVDSNAKLREEVESLRGKVADLDVQGGSLLVMVDELNRLKLVNGLMEVTGPGITVYLDGPMSATELQDMVNELRNSGAEAISLNEQRIITRSSLVSTEEGISVDGTPIMRPFIFQALGDPDTLRVALIRKGGLLTSLQAAHPGFQSWVDTASSLIFPIFARKLEFKYAQAVKR